MRMRTLELTVGAFMVAGVLALVFLALRVSGLSMESREETSTMPPGRAMPLTTCPDAVRTCAT